MNMANGARETRAALRKPMAGSAIDISGSEFTSGEKMTMAKLSGYSVA